jgi:hypothetical protein
MGLGVGNGVGANEGRGVGTPEGFCVNVSYGELYQTHGRSKLYELLMQLA